VTRPQKGEYATYYQSYIDLVPKGDLIQILDKQNDLFCAYFANVPEDKADYRYEKGKWSIKEVVGHINDTEMVFLYRLMRFSRKDFTALPGFDQDNYIKASNYGGQALTTLVEQFYLQRKLAIHFLTSLSTAMWKRKGEANGEKMSVRAAAYIMAGHVIHHMQIIQKRYIAAK